MTPVKRREFLTMTASAAAALGVAGAWADGRPVPLGLQLYMVRDAVERDFDGTLRQVADMGYRHVELPFFFGRSPGELRRSLESVGLSCRSTHVLAQPLFPGAVTLSGDIDKAIDACVELAVEYVVCPMPLLRATLVQQLLAANFDGDEVARVFAEFTLDDWRRHAEFLNGVGARFAAAGIKLAHHTHNLEFRDFGGETGFDVLLKQTDPATVSFELDCGWVVAAGLDPVELLQRYGGRIPLVHLKDLTKKFVPNTELRMDSVECGHGVVNWPALLSAVTRAGVRYAYVEQEPPAVRPTLESAQMSLKFLQRVRWH